ncbi:hyaluronan / mRNA binding family protein, partial [Ostertagia ostertagi]
WERKTVSQPAANVVAVVEVVAVELEDHGPQDQKGNLLNVSEKPVEAEAVVHEEEVVVAVLHSEGVVEVLTLLRMLQRTSKGSADEVPSEMPPAEFQGERRGRGGRGAFNGERRGRGAFRGGRQFDRQSGSDRTGVRGDDKKGGYGRGNWGDVKDELAGETEPIVVPEEPEVPREKTAEELAQEALEAEYAKQKTLKEYIDSQKKEAPKFNVRKAGEGEEENFGKLVKLQKEVVVDKEEEEVSIIRREPREKALHIDIQFAEPNRGFRGDRPPRGGRGARGGGRGGRGGNRAQVPPQFDSSLDAFPALGSK